MPETVRLLIVVAQAASITSGLYAALVITTWFAFFKPNTSKSPDTVILLLLICYRLQQECGGCFVGFNPCVSETKPERSPPHLRCLLQPPWPQPTWDWKSLEATLRCLEICFQIGRASC